MEASKTTLSSEEKRLINLYRRIPHGKRELWLDLGFA